MVKTSCGFCETTTRKITNEHIVGEWIGPLIGAGMPGFRMRNTFKLDDTNHPPWTTLNLDQKVRMACDSCNTGWMSDLETTVKPIITPVIRGHNGVHLNLRAQLRIATWALKTAMVAEFLQKSPTRYITQTERRSLMVDGRPSHTGVHVWLGRYADKSPGVHGLVATMVHVPGVPSAHISMFAFGQLALQVLVERSPGWQQRAFAARPGQWGRMLSQIWPPPPIIDSRVPLVWPPPLAVTPKNFRAVFDRFMEWGTERGSHRPKRPL